MGQTYVLTAGEDGVSGVPTDSEDGVGVLTAGDNGISSPAWMAACNIVWKRVTWGREKAHKYWLGPHNMAQSS